MDADNNKNSEKFGFVAVIGAPNAGKSTLVNECVGTKVSIVSPKVQTTRMTVRGILIENNCQIVFIDTPGIFFPKKRMERAIVNAAWEGQSGADMIILVIDAARPRDKETKAIIEKLKNFNADVPLILVINKIDKIKKEKLMAISEELNGLISFDATFMISALKGKGTKDLINYLVDKTPENDWMYPEDQVSDMPLRLLAAEITREKLFHKLHQELPHSLTVETEEWEEFKDGSIKISQIIYLAKEAHKGMVLGKGGSVIKSVGKSSRKELEEIIGTNIHLNLFVKVRPKWMEKPEHYSILGLDYSS
jgi:GTP-binding protein Era